MWKRVIVAGVAGGLVLILWSFLANGVFGFRSRIDLNRVPEESRVYTVLKETIVAPGAYAINPEVVPGTGYPPGEPVFSVRYSGVGHEAAGRVLLLNLALAFAAPTIAAWLLALASAHILARYWRRVLYFAGIGLLIAVFGGLPRWDIGGYPVKSALLLSAYDLVAWTLCGLAAAWPMRAGASARSPAGTA